MNPPKKLTAAGKKSEQGQRDMRNLEKTDVRKEASAKTGTQKWNKEPRPDTTATKQDSQENHRGMSSG
jgi:hypothetical protein